MSLKENLLSIKKSMDSNKEKFDLCLARLNQLVGELPVLPKFQYHKMVDGWAATFCVFKCEREEVYRVFVHLDENESTTLHIDGRLAAYYPELWPVRDVMVDRICQGLSKDDVERMLVGYLAKEDIS